MTARPPPPPPGVGGMAPRPCPKHNLAPFLKVRPPGPQWTHWAHPPPLLAERDRERQVFGCEADTPPGGVHAALCIVPLPKGCSLGYYGPRVVEWLESCVRRPCPDEARPGSAAALYTILRGGFAMVSGPTPSPRPVM